MTAVLTERTPRVAAARKLLRRASRLEAGRFLVEGVRPVHDALTWAEEGPGRVHDLFLTDAVADRDPTLEDRAIAAGVRVARVTEKAAAGLSDTVTPQGVAVVCSTVTVGLDAALGEHPRLVTVLAGVADPGNAGTVIRTSDAAGADAVVLAGDSRNQPVDPHNGKCVRATMGSLFHLPLAVARDVDAVVAALRERGLTLLAAAGDGETVLDASADPLLAAPTAWLFGSEAHGLDDDTTRLADHRVRVPIHGRAESLNLATAAAVCLYASARAHH
ncbi:TrmH family RNA methyltransferase [Actinomycetospora lemnae]|uniref:RNA methyltransferase n=1 Tax=Actinomycetospora lemnae TaxID=3019891 RepID=A0ABT5T1I2_9PSEU|nr:RNA methyltransferase [Actinomycetospora sp. DW7H6]MDD7968889.1 RNA methyltransferase [Actinomycetospora sp. DW7H6]